MSTPPRPGLQDDILASAARRSFPAADAGPDRGIAVCAGGPVMLVNAYVLVRILRDTHGCTLPIEIWHMGPAEMPAHIATLFTGLGCEVRDAFDVPGPGGGYRPCDGWQLKTHALAWSRFQQVLLLDADQVPVVDPACVFDWPETRETGAVFWPDLVELASTNPVWEVTGLEPRNTRSMESGQLCIDRTRHWHSLCVADEINRRAETFYSMIYGDKDTFLLAWILTDSAFAMVPHLPYQSERCLFQRDFKGNPVFQHRTNAKFTLNGPQVFPEGFRHAADCERYLAELGRVWNGRIYHPPVRSPDAHQSEQAIIETRCFSLLGPNGSTHQMNLLPGHQVGLGRSHELANWHVADGAGGLELVLMDPKKPAMILAPAGNGSWQGTRLIEPVAAVHLFPSDPADEGKAGASRWLRLLVETASGDAAALRTTLGLLGRADPGLTADLNRLAVELAETSPATAELLSDVACHLELPAAHGGGHLHGRSSMDPPFYRRT